MWGFWCFKITEKWCSLTQCTTTTPALLDICNVSSLHCFALWLVSKCIECDATQHPHCWRTGNVSSWPGWSLVHYQGATTLIETDSEQLIHGKVHRGRAKKIRNKCFWTKNVALSHTCSISGDTFITGLSSKRIMHVFFRRLPTRRRSLSDVKMSRWAF